jgi:hypothetical protein
VNFGKYLTLKWLIASASCTLPQLNQPYFLKATSTGQVILMKASLPLGLLLDILLKLLSVIHKNILQVK